jgi:outer membrane receptor for ferric coprogen and ferric-rhodotorulic acid
MPVGDNAPRFDSFFDRVEVVKGASGLTGSTGSPSATINMVRKRPEKEFKGNVSSTYGSWDNTRVEADVSIPLTQDGSVRSRFMAAYTDKESYMDRYKLKSTAAMGIISADLTPTQLPLLGFNIKTMTLKAQRGEQCHISMLMEVKRIFRETLVYLRTGAQLPIQIKQFLQI